MDVDPEEFRARYTRYTSIQTRNAASKARRDRLNSTKASKGTANSPRNNRSDKEQSPARTSSLTAYMRSQTTHMADALLHNDARPGYAGPATVSLDSEGILHLARKLPGMVFCLKIYYVNEVNPIWNIALRAVNDLKVWLDRQFLAPQQITRMPKLNPRAVTTLDQVWELLAEFDATAKHKSAFIRATPIALASKIPIVEASVIFPIQPAQTAVAIPQVGMIAGSSMPDTSNHLAPPKSHDKQGPAGPSTYHNVFPQSGEMSLHHKNQVQRAEIVRLKTSVYKYSTRIRGANGEIRSLRNDLRDAQNRNSDLQDKYDRAKTMVDRTAGTEATAEVSHIILPHAWILPSMQPLLLREDILRPSSQRPSSSRALLPIGV